MKITIDFTSEEKRMMMEFVEEDPTTDVKETITGKFGHIKYDGLNKIDMEISNECIKSLLDTVAKPAVQMVKAMISMYKAWTNTWFNDLKHELGEQPESKEPAEEPEVK